MKYVFFFLVVCIHLFGFSSNYAQDKSALPSPLSLHAGHRPFTITLNISNPTPSPAFFIRPDKPWHWYGWELQVRDENSQEYHFIPAPSPWLAGTDSYILLLPGESFQTDIDLALAVKKSDRTINLAQQRGKYEVSINYVFDGEREIIQSPHSQLAQTFSLITGKPQFRIAKYIFMGQVQSNTLILDTNRPRPLRGKK